VLRVSVIELPATWGKPQTMLKAAKQAIAVAAPDLALLPEASLTGYVSPKQDFDLSPFAEAADGPTAQACADLARKSGTHLVAPLVLKEGDALFNAFACYGPDGKTLFTYRKRHPWFPETWATPGPQPLPLVDIGGLEVSLAICFDVHFLEEESAAQLEQADVLLFPSAWVDDSPEPARPALLQQLARRFELNVVNANWGLGNPPVRGQGRSVIYGRSGEVLAEMKPGHSVATAELT
jgi:predicted amidohydrolase